MQADLFVGAAHQNWLFWFFSVYFIESFSVTTTRKFLFRFFFFCVWGGFLPLLPRQDSVHKLSISLVVKKWICSLMRLVIIWSAVTCHRFLQIFVQNCWIRAAICSCRGGKKLGEKKRKTNKPVFVSLQLFHFFLLIISFSFFVSTREIYIPFG